jgi:hypothetical protein
MDPVNEARLALVRLLAHPGDERMRFMVRLLPSILPLDD